MNNTAPVFRTVIVTFIGLCFAVILGSQIADGSPETIALYTVIAISIFWTIGARQNWWLPFMIFMCLAGTLKVGFKIFPVEAGTLVVLAAFIPYYILSRKNLGSARKPLPIWFFIAFLYFSAHLVYSLVTNKFENNGGTENVVRVYSGMLSCFGIAILIYYFGDLKRLGLGFLLSYLTCLSCIGAGIVSDLTGIPIFVPGINYLLTPGINDNAEMAFFWLRWLGVSAIPFALFYAKTSKYFIFRLLNIFITFGLLFLILRAGGRAAFFIACLYVFVWVLANKYRSLIALGIGGSITFIAFVNASPAALKDLPFGVQRSLSPLVFDPGYKQSMGISGEGSTTNWHDYLREIAYQRWTATTLTTIIGYGAKGFESRAKYSTMLADDVLYADALQAANTGAYEKSIWSILAITGGVGLLVLLVFFFICAREFLPIIWKNGVRDANDFAVYMGLATVLIWPISGWIAGGLPQNEIIYCVLGWCCLPKKQATLVTNQRSNNEISIN